MVRICLYVCATLLLSYQRYYDFAVRVCLEVVWVLEALPHQPVVVDLAIDSEGNAIIRVGQWLSTALDADNAETFVGKNWRYASDPRSLISPLIRTLFSPVLLAKYEPDQSGPRCRHCLAILRAVGLKAFASGTW
jgi:hypothetical protein